VSLHTRLPPPIMQLLPIFTLCNIFVPIPNQIIKNFESLTGFPIVLNTSFNIAGEPVVLSPDDALTKFYNSGLEYLIIGSFLVKK